MRIRRMRQEDIPEVALLEKQVFSTPWTAKSLEESLKQPFYYFLVAEEKEIVGYMGVYKVMEEGNVTDIAVCGKKRRQGIAGALVEKMLELCGQNGIHSVTLEVRASNLAAIALYEKYGFQAVGTRPDFYEKPQEDAVIMWKKRF